MANWKWILGHIALRRWKITACIALMMAEGAALLATVAMQKVMIDDVFLGQQYHLFGSLMAAVIGAYAVYSLLFTLVPYLVQRNIAAMRSNMYDEFLTFMERVPILRWQKERTADYVYRLTTDIFQAAHTAGSDIPKLVQQLTTVVILAVIIGFASPFLLLATGGLSCLYLVLGRRFARLRKRAADEVNAGKAELLVHLEESVSATREVIANDRQSWERERFNDRFNRYFASVLRQTKLLNQQLLACDPVKWAANLLVLGYGGLLVLQGKLSLGMFVVTYQYARQLMDTVQQMYDLSMNVSGYLSSVERIRQVTEAEGEADGTLPFRDEVRRIGFHHVSFDYGDAGKRILHRVSLELPAGRKIAFVGESGSGKSTIAKLLIRFYDPCEGMVTVNDRTLAAVRRTDWLDKVGIVFQEPYFFPGSIRHNLQLGAEQVSESELVRACQIACIHEFVTSLPNGYDTTIGERGISLSGGQRQRLALARILLKEPEILILDEATSALDVETEYEVQRNLDEARRGKTTIVIAHRLSTVQNADVIFVLDKGHIAGQGKHDELLRVHKGYQRLVAAQHRASASLSI
ncbi:ABC transporter ATP-binding protein [Paenibacillus elgii]